MSWNIHGARDARVGAIAREIAGHQPDIACLNEVPRCDGRRLGRATGMRAFVASSFIGPYGNAILTGMPVASWRRLRFAGTHRVDRRDAAIVTLSSGIEVASIHLNLRSPRRLRDIDQLLGALPGRAVVAGDHNEGPGGGVWRALAERFDDACTAEGAPTFPAAEPRARIDLIWVPRDARVTSCRVAATSLSDHRPVIVDVDLG